MRRALTFVLVSCTVLACGGGTATDIQAPDADALTPIESAQSTPAGTSSPIPASTGGNGDAADVAPVPAYDVFLAAVARALEGTRYQDAPFQDPEVFAATGLLLCERIEDGTNGEQVVLEYLTELTGGNAASADDDQMALTGALMGAAEEALCPQTGSG